MTCFVVFCLSIVKNVISLLCMFLFSFVIVSSIFVFMPCNDNDECYIVADRMRHEGLVVKQAGSFQP